MVGMSIVVIGQLATSEGALGHVDRAGDVEPSWLPAIGYLRHQPASVPVLVDHDEGFRVGRVEHLERSKVDGLLAVCRLDVDMADMLSDGDWFLSSHVNCLNLGDKRHSERALLSEVSLTRKPALYGACKVRWARSTLAPQWMRPLRWYDTWARGCEAMTTAAYRRAKRLQINDLDRLDFVDELVTDPSAARRRAALAAPAVKPAPPPEPDHAGCVRFDGAWLSPEVSARFMGLLDSGCSLDAACRLIRASA